MRYESIKNVGIEWISNQTSLVRSKDICQPTLKSKLHSMSLLTMIFLSFFAVVLHC